MKRLFTLLFTVFLCIPLTGCWGSKGINDQLYIEALGIDYKDGKYVVYTESAVFSSIAKQEGGGAQAADSPVLIGMEEGDSLTMAFRRLERSSQFPLYYGHIQVILLSERVIKERLPEVISHLGHDPLIRFTSWVYGTSAELSDVLVTKAPFKQAPLYKVLFHPEDMMRRNHAVDAMNMQVLMRDGSEPYGTTIIPSVELWKGKWMEDKEQPLTPAVSGGFVLSNMKLKAKMSYEELHGLQWVNKQKKENKLEIPINKTVVEVVIKGYESALDESTDDLKYTLKVKAKAYIDENLGTVPLPKLERKISKLIEEDILRTYQNGVKIKSDLYNLTRSTYRSAPDLVKSFSLKPDSLADVQVKVQVVNAGSKKYLR